MRESHYRLADLSLAALEFGDAKTADLSVVFIFSPKPPTSVGGYHSIRLGL